jgi:hypothetical protein
MKPDFEMIFFDVSLLIRSSNGGTGGHHLSKRIPVSPKVRDEDFHPAARDLPVDCVDSCGKVCGAAVRQVVPCDRCDHNIL